MRYKQLKLSAILVLGLGLVGLQAQEVIPTTGGESSGNGSTASYSVGQQVYQTYTGAGGSIAEGVQQPYEISVETGLEEVKGINLTVSAYPNPTANYLTLTVDNFELSTLTFQLYNMNGKLLQSRQISSKETSIIMSNLVPAIYFVEVIQRNKKIKTFKIIKN